jgi:hypothetical protein
MNDALGVVKATVRLTFRAESHVLHAPCPTIIVVASYETDWQMPEVR